MADSPAGRFPLASRYDPAWVLENSLGENVLYNLESLCRVLPPLAEEESDGLRILDLGCGRAVSSIFLAREYDAEVWAVDHGVDPDDNRRRTEAMGVADRVFPLHADARELPFAHDFFDLVLVVDSYYYFGTDERYLPYLIRFLREGGRIAVADLAFSREIDGREDAPAYLHDTYREHWFYVHTLPWWERLWERTGLVEIETAERLPETDWIWERFVEDYADADEEIDRHLAEVVRRDRAGERVLDLFRMVGRRRGSDPYLEPHELENPPGA